MTGSSNSCNLACLSAVRADSRRLFVRRIRSILGSSWRAGSRLAGPQCILKFASWAGTASGRAPDGTQAWGYDRWCGSGMSHWRGASSSGFPWRGRVAFLPDAASCVCSCVDGDVHFLAEGWQRWLADFGLQIALILSACPAMGKSGHGQLTFVKSGIGDRKGSRPWLTRRWIWAVAISPDGKRVIAGGDDKVDRIWVLENGKEAIQLGGHQDAVTCVAFSPGSLQALTGSNDGELRHWNLENGQMLRRMVGPKSPIYSVAFSREVKHGFSAGADGVIRLWELAAAQERPNGALGISGKGRRSVMLDAYGNPVNAENGKEIRRYEGHDGAVTE